MAVKALLRLEDLGPYPIYANSESLIKLQAIVDYLLSQNVPFQISVVPRAVDPSLNYDKSIAQLHDPIIVAFNQFLRYCIEHGGTLDMEGYTHQYALSTLSYEYNVSYAVNNIPPDDVPQACSDLALFNASYASSRMREGYDTFRKSGLPFYGCYVTPNYTASTTQRCIIQSWNGVFVEDDPYNPGSRTMHVNDIDRPFFRGVVYVPTPLGYVSQANPEADVIRICTEVQTYTGNDLASFYYHPYLEFPFIHITPGGDIIYDDNSYLKQLIRFFHTHGLQFYPIYSVYNFIPSMRQTNFFPSDQYELLTGDVNADNKTDFIIWNPVYGNWTFAFSNVENYHNRQIGGFSTKLALSNWAVGTTWKPLIGDFNGDKLADVVVWNPPTGNWQVALSNGTILNPNGSWLSNWAVGSYWVPFSGDFNGDGRADLLVWYPYAGYWHIALSNGGRFVPNGIWLENWAASTKWVPLIGDFNGDGKDDIVVWNPDTGEWQVALSNGSSFIPSGIWLLSWGIGNTWKARIGDFNGDGKDDLLIVDTSLGSWNTAISTGAHFLRSEQAFYPWAADPQIQPYTGDFNGMRADSICARNPVLRNGTIDIAIPAFSMQNYLSQEIVS